MKKNELYLRCDSILPEKDHSVQIACCLRSFHCFSAFLAGIAQFPPAPQSSLPFLCPFLPLSTSRKPVLRAECVTCLRSHSIFRRLRRVPGTAPLSSPSPSSTGQEVRGVHQAVSWGGKARGSGCSWTAIEVAPGGGGRLGVPSTRSHTALHTAASLAPAGSVGVDTPPLVCP